MDLLTTLENGLFTLVRVLRLPVMALLWVCVIAALFMVGSCLLDSVTRRRERRVFDLDGWLRGGPVLTADQGRLLRLPSMLRSLLGEVEKARIEDTLSDGGLEHLALEFEERIRRTLTGPRMLVRVGPSLGLIGTLMLMGTPIAITPATIGLLVGTAAYVISTVRVNWVDEAVREQRYLTDRIARELARSPAAEVTPPGRELTRL